MLGLLAALTLTSITQLPPPAPTFRLFRYDDILPRAADDLWNLTFGGELRTRYEYFDNPGFGLRPFQHDDFIAQRLLLHANLRDADRFRAFAQVLSGFQIASESPVSPAQDNVLDLQQAFIDLRSTPDADSTLTFRAGRQEMGFGSFRLVTARDATNARLAFDGLRVTFASSATTIDAFLTRPVRNARGIFNDSPDRDQAFWGLYSATPLANNSKATLDLYYLGLDRAASRFASATAAENRHSLGARLAGTLPTSANAGQWDYDLEAVIQFGTFGQQRIRAWTIASSTGYTFTALPAQPRIGLKANIASGDRNPANTTLATFNPLFPRNNYFNDANLITPANFFNLHPSLTIRPLDTLTLAASADFFFRTSTTDAVYAPGRIAIPASASTDRFVGTALTFQADWTISLNLTWTLACTHFARGPVVTDARGTDVTFLGTWITFRF